MLKLRPLECRFASPLVSGESQLTGSVVVPDLRHGIYASRHVACEPPFEKNPPAKGGKVYNSETVVIYTDKSKNTRASLTQPSQHGAKYEDTVKEENTPSWI